MLLKNRRVRIGLSVVFGVTLALVSGAHALSSAVTRNSPELALALWPSNGLASEKIAYRKFVQSVRENQRGVDNRDVDARSPDADLDNQFAAFGDQMRQSAVASSAVAIQALKVEPLSPRALALIALSQSDRTRKDRIVALASRLSRRDLPLQALVLQSRLAAADYTGTMETLDQILRVHPQRQAEFFPVLTNALKERATIPAFRDLLSKPLPWRDAFLMHALNDPKAARNLAEIRNAIRPDNADFDKGLIANLARNGDLETSASLYRQLAKPAAQGSGFAWTSEYPPFDWTFADQAGLRAQLSKDGRHLEFAVDPGNGGVIASRVMRLPRAPFTVTIRHEVSEGGSLNDLKLTLGCLNQGTAFFEASFAQGNGRFDVSRRPDCNYVLVALSARAWTGADPLNGTFVDMLVVPR